jgi:hypothetical protein
MNIDGLVLTMNYEPSTMNSHNQANQQWPIYHQIF